ncbi:hypothetical protein [Reichenbachiella sp.]|uniref:hypothetical protein n=1 Tax=Reichenbachiella sp. TaxID=2184521 RepID=UPI003B5A909E
MVGDLFDPHHPKKSNKEILETLANKPSFNEVLTATFDLAGKFILIYHDNNEFTLFHDPAGLREVFYLKGQPNTPCASQPTLFAEYKNLQPTADSLASVFYSSPAFHQRKERILDTTQYEGLCHLQPNYYLDLSTGIANRFFPNEPLTRIGLKEAVDKSVLYLKGIFESMTNRYQLMIAVTAGMDSRVMLAASRQLTQEIFYFILNSDRLKKDSLDIITPQKLLDKMGLSFHILEQGEEVSETVKTTLLKNVELMLHRHFNFWYNVFYKKKGYMNITSVSEFARNYYHYEANPNKVTGKDLALLNKYKGNEFVSQVYEEWLATRRASFQSNGYNTLDMFYWEEKMGNWLANGRSSMGSVIEDFSPFNCRNLMITFLAVDEKYRGRYNSIFHKKIIEKLCPEALQEPINGSKKYKVINILVMLGIYPLFKKVQLLLRE